jgi:ketosteroid isomerase-like protein
MYEAGDVFWAVGRERERLEPEDGQALLDLAIRTTRLFRRGSDGRWRQVHHHGSFEDPGLLDAYRRMVR